MTSPEVLKEGLQSPKIPFNVPFYLNLPDTKKVYKNMVLKYQWHSCSL